METNHIVLAQAAMHKRTWETVSLKNVQPFSKFVEKLECICIQLFTISILEIKTL